MFNVETLLNEYHSKPPESIIALALDRFAKIAISFSGAEDVVLIDMAVKIDPHVQVFSLDTGRLHEQTYRFIEQVRDHYQIDIELLFPDAATVQALVHKKGLYSFYQDGHQECCSLRKVMPLRRKLSKLSAWISGQRHDQSPSTRANVAIIEQDRAFSTAEQPLIKFNPLANWRSGQVWDYIKKHNVPYNTLHEQGYISIGCEPCTRPTLPNQHERAGRWWWEDATKKECGLHSNEANKP